MITLNNPIADFYKQAELEGRIIKLPQGDVERCAGRINAEMERFDREWKYKCAKSIEELMHSYVSNSP
ncbi:MAG: hypothetical protein PHQ66_02360 [Candidatus Nanoarchaeia archaeon]|nr:hypothetical protein [Candidatus Nanoarchaeia archaeon]MDD5357788.1 hypothetical protein [Candidatus Nanoarchaeia archaeon]MDD5588707.1 hypothetical protein [Candidatus Nanoarchaeia archaeon]